MIECINSNWNVRELQRQIKTLLYERIINGKEQDKINELAVKGNKIFINKDIITANFVTA